MFDTEIIEVSETITCVRRPSYMTCSYVLTPGDDVLLIDAGMDSEGADVRAGLEAVGASLEDVSTVALTHWHNDHAAGGHYTQVHAGAEVVYHRDESEFFLHDDNPDDLRWQLSELMPEWGIFVLFKGLLGEAPPKAVEANRHVEDGDVIAGELEVLETPGHTPGHLSFYYPRERALFAGDALAVIGDEARFMARPVTPDLAEARRSMAKCLDREIDLLCPGHRRPLTRDVANECGRLLERVTQQDHWPLFG